MLGITVADAVAICGVALSLLMAFLGLKDGSKAKINKPPPPDMAIMGATLVDTSTMRDVAEALREVNGTMREWLAFHRSTANDRVTELLEELVRRGDPPAPRRRPRKRGGP